MPTDLQDIATALHAVAGAIREAAPKPLGRHVIGGPVPKAGEKSENVYLREEVAELKAARDEAKRETGEWRKAYDATAMALAEVKAQSRNRQDVLVLLDNLAERKRICCMCAERACDAIRAMTAPKPPADAEILPGMDAHILAEARATARLEAIEEAAQAIETVGGGSQSDRMIARFCADRVRALGTAEEAADA